MFGRRGRDGTKAEDVSFGGQDFNDPKVRERFQQQQKPQLSSSIFEEEVDEAVADSGRGGKAPASVTLKTPETTAWRLDPDPRSRIRWERKKVIQMVRRNGRVSRSERIAQTEKELSHKSPFLETSVKKLVPLARQIQGKTLEDALVQMTFSKKKMAREVKHQLEEARDLAIVTRGMGLGNAGQKTDKRATKPVKIQTRDGNGFTVDDPTRLYVAQAWVGKGPWRSKSLDYKGRGRFGIIQSPSTSMLLKTVQRPWLLRRVANPVFYRHFGCAEGGEDENTRAQREVGPGGTEEALGPFARPASNRTETLLFLVVTSESACHS